MGGGGRGRGRKRGRTQRRDFNDGRSNEWKKSRVEGDATDGPDADVKGWEPFVLESSSFELYYKEQGLVPEEEWEEFMATLRKPLPTTFRINTIGQFASNIRTQLQRDFYERLKDGLEDDGEGRLVQPICPLAWYPGNFAWQLGYSRTELRRVPILEKIHEFLKQENEIGSITRQEAVSMVPPLLLDVQPHHRVLDMCAAPGSKTFQLLEMIHSSVGPGEIPKGMVIANDSDVQRCHLLVHQTKRMCSPNILVTNHEAQRFPGLKGNLTDGDDMLLFDRILCDVPCSGDGTVRKAPDIWKKWNTGVANGLHRLQIQIAMRGVALLKVSGRLVYSTCSLNPIEDEAVVSAILRESGGSMELLDVSSELPDLKRRSGMTTWKVRDRGQWLTSASQVNMARAGSIMPSMFPSWRGYGKEELNADRLTQQLSMTGTDVSNHGRQSSGGHSCSSKEMVVANGSLSTSDVEGDRKQLEGNGEADNRLPEEPEAEVSELPLQRCMRILPHDQDTGGFFIAVFRKVSPWKLHPHKIAVPRRAVNHESTQDGGNGAVAEKDIGISGDQVNDPVRPFECGTVAPDEAETEIVASETETIVECGKADAERAVAEQDLDSTDGLDDINTQVDDEVVLEVPEIVEASAKNLVVDGVAEGVEDVKKPKSRFQQQGRWRGVDPVLFLEDEGIIRTLVDYYGIKDSFPLKGHLITRSEDNSRLKRIYFVSESVSDTIKGNYSAGQPMKITSAGLKIFERQQSSAPGASQCAFRIVSEGLPTLLPHMAKQIVNCRSRKDFKTLLLGKAVPFHAVEDPLFAAALQELHIGCCVIAFLDTSNQENSEERSVAPGKDSQCTPAVGCWRGRHNVSLLLSQAEAGQMLERLSLGGDDESSPEPDRNSNGEAVVQLETISVNDA